jgi:hypothetical protein
LTTAEYNRYTQLNQPVLAIGQVEDFDYTSVSHYIYCYLDPTKQCVPTYEMEMRLYDEVDPLLKDDEVNLKTLDDPRIKSSDYKFDFIVEPMYVGRAVNFKGFRLYMHLSDYLRGNLTHDKKKFQRFRDIEHWLDDEDLDWRWYKRNCIIVLSQVLGTSSLNHHVATEMLNRNEKKIIRQMLSDDINLVNEIVYH